MLDDRKVSISKMKEIRKGYPQRAPFYPPIIYPELKRLHIQWETDKSNQVYEAVRNAFISMELDKKNIALETWNPLSEIIKPGESIVIKPNFVIDFNINDRTNRSTITHGSVIRAVIDYIILALCGKGKIIIADAPQMDCNFDRLIKKNGMRDIIDYYKRQLSGTSIEIELVDLRTERVIYKHGVVWKRIKLKGDPLGYTVVDLKEDSEMNGLDPKKFYGADYNRRETIAAHIGGHHKYFVSNTILKADVIISMPKLKVHRKVGVTLNIKNMVGISGNKNFLVHYQVGTQSQGGDEFSVESRQRVFDRIVMDMTIGKNWKYGKYLYAAYLKGKDLLNIKDKYNQNISGDWKGNDTTWRMAADLNKVLLFTGNNGIPLKEKRKYFSVIDGIIGGEGEGPLEPKPVKSGVIIMGINPIAVDIVATVFMGLDYKKIKYLKERKRRIMDFQVKDIEIVGMENLNIKKVDSLLDTYKYKVPSGWNNYL